MKAIILARVSTDEQMTEGQSIPAQLEKARHYAQRKELEIKSEYQFDESSIKDRRVKFEKVIEEIKASKEPLALIVETIDRLQRSFKESVLLDDFRKQGHLEIHFIRENLCIHKDSNSSELTRWDIGVLFARNFVLQISDNVRRTQDFKVRNGEYPAMAPFGYMNIQNEDGKAWIAPDSKESIIVIKAYEWYSTGAFSMEGIRSKIEEVFGVKLSKGQIDFILKQPFYCGEMQYSGKLWPHKYQTIISKQLFDQVQSVKLSFGKQPFKFAGLPYLYRGLLRCGKCGCAFTPEKKTKKSGKEYVYYHCTQYHGKCGTEWLREEEITAQFSQIVENIHVPDDIAQELTETLRASHQGKVEFHENLRNDLQNKYAKLQKRIETMYEDKLDGSITESFYNEKRQEYREQQDKIKLRLDTLQSADEDYYLSVSYLLKVANKAPALFKGSEPTVKRKILKLLLQNCNVNGVTLCPTYRSPFDLFAEGAICQSWLPGLDELRNWFLYGNIIEINPHFQMVEASLLGL